MPVFVCISCANQSIIYEFWIELSRFLLHFPGTACACCKVPRHGKGEPSILLNHRKRTTSKKYINKNLRKKEKTWRTKQSGKENTAKCLWRKWRGRRGPAEVGWALKWAQDEHVKICQTSRPLRPTPRLRLAPLAFGASNTCSIFLYVLFIFSLSLSLALPQNGTLGWYNVPLNIFQPHKCLCRHAPSPLTHLTPLSPPLPAPTTFSCIAQKTTTNWIKFENIVGSQAHAKTLTVNCAGQSTSGQDGGGGG